MGRCQINPIFLHFAFQKLIFQNQQQQRCYQLQYYQQELRYYNGCQQPRPQQLLQ